MVRKDIQGMQEGGRNVFDDKSPSVVNLEFPKESRTPLQIGLPAEGSTSWKGARLGFSYADGVEDTNM